MIKMLYVYITLLCAIIMLIFGGIELIRCFADYVAPPNFSYSDSRSNMHALISSSGYIVVPIPLIYYFNKLRLEIK